MAAVEKKRPIVSKYKVCSARQQKRQNVTLLFFSLSEIENVFAYLFIQGHALRGGVEPLHA